MSEKFKTRWKLLTLALLGATCASSVTLADHDDGEENGSHAKNIILFVGDGMGVSTVTATRIFSVGVDGQLVMDQMPFTALSRTYTPDHITPDSAGTMSAMMTGVNTNSGIIGLDATTERGDFNNDGDGMAPWTLLEMAKHQGMKVGVVTTARVTHATPAACYAHINERNHETDIALQSLPTDQSYNWRLEGGLDVLMGGGRRFFVPAGTTDEEGESGSRSDGRDLRVEFQNAGYTYVWNQNQFNTLTGQDLPVLGLFDRSHMKWEYDRPLDVGGEPSLSEMTQKAVDLLQNASNNDEGYFLMVESGRIDHAHHAGNAFRAMVDTENFDQAIGAVLSQVDLENTLVIVTADHSHVFSLAGYPMVAASKLPYAPKSVPTEYANAPFDGILNTVFNINNAGDVFEAADRDGVPYTILGYVNGPGYRDSARTNPRFDSFPGLDGNVPSSTNDPEYRQEAAVPRSSETHAGEEVAIYAVGPQSFQFHGTVKNTRIFEVMRNALELNQNFPAQSGNLFHNRSRNARLFNALQQLERQTDSDHFED